MREVHKLGQGKVINSLPSKEPNVGSNNLAYIPNSQLSFSLRHI